MPFRHTEHSHPARIRFRRYISAVNGVRSQRTHRPARLASPYERVISCGMGKVWRAHHTALKRYDALKVLRDASCRNPTDWLDSGEKRRLSSLNHRISRTFTIMYCVVQQGHTLRPQHRLAAQVLSRQVQTVNAPFSNSSSHALGRKGDNMTQRKPTLSSS